MGIPLIIADAEEITLGLSLHEARALYLADLRIRKLLDTKDSKEEERKVAKGDTVALSDASDYALALSGSKEAANEDHQDSEKNTDEEGKAEESKEQDRAKETSPKAPQDLTPAEEEEVKELKRIDQEVRIHENAHKAAAGELAVGGPVYEYEEGPDGKSYAVAGEVQIALREGSTPEETLQYARKAKKAALAPAQPSAKDRAVAAEAEAMAAKARSEIAKQRQDMDPYARKVLEIYESIEQS
ncbi:MAG: putative metalloprotease CJM1_0395 family protein [Myxococcota bacterium]|jgi:hypothetical protein|nr:putative metalloprotease CJM1_0395 family protein [Myxococcota bacterium]